MVRSTQTVHISCNKISTISTTDQIELPLAHRHLGVPSGASKTIPDLIVCLAQTVHLSCTDTNTLQTEWNEIPHDPRPLGVWLVAFKMTSEPMVRSAQTVHLSCTESNTVSKRTETRFHVTHVTQELYQVCSKWFLSEWYVRCKPCTNLILTLTLSLSGLKPDSTWPTSHRRFIGCVKNDFQASSTFDANRAPMLRQD
jgi:hypothetical protein